MLLRVVLGATIAASAASIALAQGACTPKATGSGEVRTVVDGRTLRLTDGREVRLAGIEVQDGAKFALEALVSGREVTLFGADRDRYGRVVALVAPAGSPAAQSVQQALLAQGLARISANIGDSGCTSALLGAEQAARRAGLGLWADPHYVMRQAEDPAGILAFRGRFAVVEGKIISVRESGGTIYVNFGRRWSEDFTVTVPKRNERSFAAAGLELKKLTGQRVRVRGTVEERGGPWIEAARPEQIEIAERD